MHPALSWIVDELAALDVERLRRDVRLITPLPGGRCSSNGRELINFGSNDYLGLSGDPRLREAMEEVTVTGAGASPLVTGYGPWHERLEAELAAFDGTEAAIVFPSGYAANMGTVQALADGACSIYFDRLIHASLVDGARSARSARLQVFPHNDAGALRELLQKDADRREKKLVLTDSIFSMDGDMAPLVELCDACDEFGAILLVDEAHATGIMGAGGRGVCELLGVEHRVPVRVGTLSKSVGVQGGFVVGEKPLIDWLRNRARTQFFSTALSPILCAAAIRSLQIIRQEPWRRERIGQMRDRVLGALQELGFTPPHRVIGPIIPVVLGDVDRALEAARLLEQQGLFVPAIRPPSVKEGTARLRISLNAAHSDDAIQHLIDGLRRVLVADSNSSDTKSSESS
jgi:8-amino-7-oxononanoate synthase